MFHVMFHVMSCLSGISKLFRQTSERDIIIQIRILYQLKNGNKLTVGIYGKKCKLNTAFFVHFDN